MSKHLIFSRNGNDSELGLDRLRQMAPAIFSDTKRETLSDRYVQLNTSSLLPVMSDFGYVPVQAVQRFGRKVSAEHNHHLVAFAHRDDLIGAVDGREMRPEIIMYNSHDGTGAVRLFAGAYRFICSNGIIAGDGFSSRIYHNKNAIAGFEDMLRNTVQNLPLLMDKIENLRSKTLTAEQAHNLAVRSAKVRWDWAKAYAEDAPIKRGSYATQQTVESLLTAQRLNDVGNDAWTVFNRIQENVIRGDAMIKSFSERNPDGAMRKARPINSAAENVRVNRELWDTVEEMVA